MTHLPCSPGEHLLSRRLFLQGSLAAGAAVGGFDALFGPTSAAEAKKKQKHVILVFLTGGPSQLETWDPKPTRPTAGPHATIPTTISGVRFDEFMPGLAKLAKKMAVIRSMTTPFNQHIEGSIVNQTGHRPAASTARAPHWLCTASHLLPQPDATLPSYVMLGSDQGAFPTPGPGFLGAGASALYCPGNGKPPEDLPAGNSDLATQVQREKLRAAISGKFANKRLKSTIDEHEVAYKRMVDLLKSKQLFEIAKEPAKVREAYGETALGRDCLLARRLIEKGVSFVRVQHQAGGAWDKHRNAFESQRHLTAEFDNAVSTLINDLIDRGLYDNTLVVLMGEFGRTPKVNGAAGRDHWSKFFSLSLGGCGIKGGVVVGSTDKDGMAIKDRPVTTADLFCTFYKALGLNPHKELRYQSRPIPLVENKEGKPMAELI